MGHSITISCLGYGRERLNEEGRRVSTIYYAMNRLEIMQECKKAQGEGDPIIHWAAQTEKGKRILGDPLADSWYIPTEKVPKVKVVQCPKCFGCGCQICNRSGITTKKYLSGFQDWQLEPEANK